MVPVMSAAFILVPIDIAEMSEATNRCDDASIRQDYSCTAAFLFEQKRPALRLLHF